MTMKNEDRMQKIQVFKIGGNVVDNQSALEKFAAGFASVKGPKVLVHGGGAIASQMQKRLGMEPVMVEGRRVTDAETLKIVTMVYGSRRGGNEICQEASCQVCVYRGNGGLWLRGRSETR